MIRLGAPDRFGLHALRGLCPGKSERVVLFTLGIPLIRELDDRPAAPMYAARARGRMRGRNERWGRLYRGDWKSGMVVVE